MAEVSEEVSMMNVAVETASSDEVIARTGTTDERSEIRVLTNPYLLARREWDERYGNLITRAKNWRIAAILCASIALVQTAGMVALSMRSKVVPYVVAVDSLGRQVAAGVVEETSTVDDRLLRAALFEWVGDLRTITSDGVAQRKAIDRVYARIANGSQAMTLVNEFYRADPPNKQAQTQTVSIDVQSVFATSEKTYQVEWVETIRDLQGQVKSEDHWKGAFTIALNPPKDERLIRTNPIGIYITNASWTRVL
jgi:type IV secretion system protein TrbF